MIPAIPQAGAIQRVLLVALLAPVVLVAAAAAVPAMIVLPFLPNGTERTVKLISAWTSYTRTLLSGSREPAPSVNRGRHGPADTEGRASGS